MAQASNMSNEALQAMISEFGNQIFCIRMDDGHKIFCGVKRGGDGVSPETEGDNTTFATEIEFRNFGGCDLFRLKFIDHTWGKTSINYSIWYVTYYIQAVYLVDDPTCMDLPDLNKLF